MHSVFGPGHVAAPNKVSARQAFSMGEYNVEAAFSENSAIAPPAHDNAKE